MFGVSDVARPSMDVAPWFHYPLGSLQVAEIRGRRAAPRRPHSDKRRMNSPSLPVVNAFGPLLCVSSLSLAITPSGKAHRADSEIAGRGGDPQLLCRIAGQCEAPLICSNLTLGSYEVNADQEENIAL